MASFMFTGLIEELGQVERVERKGAVGVLTVKAQVVGQDCKIGDSIAINGVCLTLVRYQGQLLTFEVMAETSRASTLGTLRPGAKVNLERSLRIGERLSGHFVTGHIDGIGTIRKKLHRQENLCFEIAVPESLMRCIVPKGSIAVDGISLTIVDTMPSCFTVYIIPHTLSHTTLNFKGASDKVNIECDILAKYGQARLC